MVSGPGLGNCFRFLSECAGLGATPLDGLGDEELPAAVASRALGAEDGALGEVCKDALRMWLAAFVAELRAASLRFLPTGGLYLAGGVSTKLMPRLGEFIAHGVTSLQMPPPAKNFCAIKILSMRPVRLSNKRYEMALLKLLSRKNIGVSRAFVVPMLPTVMDSRELFELTVVYVNFVVALSLTLWGFMTFSLI